MNADQIKQTVKEKYTQAATDRSCCTPDYGSTGAITDFTPDYSGIEGHVADADLSLGCGIPTDVAQIKTGDTVLDLGAGAGNDVFVARQMVGTTGKVIGLDMTPAMIEKAEANRKKVGFENVEFVLGEIEAIPLPENMVDVIISNCVLNLVPNKAKAYEEAFRVLKPGGHVSISDVVTTATLPTAIQEAANLYVGCVAGALPQEEYLEIVRKAGFSPTSIVRSRPIQIPDAALSPYLTVEQIAGFRASKNQVLSITVFAQKPA